MKKVLSILLALLLFGALACYAPHGEESTVVVNDLPGVYCEIVEGTLTPTGAEVRFWHTLDRDDLVTWPMHYLEKEYLGKWYSLEMAEMFPVDTVAYHIPPESQMREKGHHYIWGDSYGTLEPGHYRVMFEVFEGTRPNRIMHIVATEFTIR